MSICYVADPNDRLAALTWLGVGPPCTPLEDILRSAVELVLDNLLALEQLKAYMHREAGFVECTFLNFL